MSELPREQAIIFEQMRLASFNSFDGNHVADALLENRDLWEAVLLDRAEYGDVPIKLRDLPSLWNVDALWIRCVAGKQKELEELTDGWGHEAMNWIEIQVFGTTKEDWHKSHKEPRVLWLWWD